MNALHLIWIIPVSALFGFAVAAMLSAPKADYVEGKAKLVKSEQLPTRNGLKELHVKVPGETEAATISVLVRNETGGMTLFTHSFKISDNVLIEWENNSKIRLKGTNHGGT